MTGSWDRFRDIDQAAEDAAAAQARAEADIIAWRMGLDPDWKPDRTAFSDMALRIAGIEPVEVTTAATSDGTSYVSASRLRVRQIGRAANQAADPITDPVFDSITTRKEIDGRPVEQVDTNLL